MKVSPTRPMSRLGSTRTVNGPSRSGVVDLNQVQPGLAAAAGLCRPVATLRPEFAPAPQTSCRPYRGYNAINMMNHGSIRITKACRPA